MSDTGFSREEQKQRLREGMIINDKTGEGQKRPSFLVYLIIAFCIAALGYGIYYRLNLRLSTEYDIVWEKDIGTAEGEIETFRGFEPFAGGIIKYSKDGAEFIDSKGSIVWERSYQLSAPIIDTGGSYAVIADQGSSDIYIFDAGGITGVCETILPISIVRISDGGVVYAVLNDSEADYITAFRPDGSAIDLSVKSIISGDGYPFDIDISPDGTQLLTSYACIENGQLVNNVVFRNFSSVGQNEDSRRVVGGFRDEFEGHIAGRVHFSDDEYSQAFYDGGVVFFSTKVLNTPEVLANVSFDERMLVIAYSEKTVAVLLDNEDNNYTEDGTGGESGNGDYRLVIFDSSGEKNAEIVLDMGYKGMCMAGNSVVIYDNTEMRVYNSKGVLRGSFSIEEEQITGAAGSSEKNNIIYMISGSRLIQARF